QAPHPVIDTAARRQNQHRCVDSQLVQLEDQADAVLVRQTKVNDQDVELAIDGQPLGRFAISCRLHLISRLFQRSSQESLNVDFVLNEQKAHEWILVHFSPVYMDKPHNEKG